MSIDNPSIDRPRMGQNVRVTSDWSRYLEGFAHWVPRINVHEGIVIESASYDELGTFRLLTKDKFDPIKVVCMEYVTSIEPIPGAPQGVPSLPEKPGTVVAAPAPDNATEPQSYAVKGSKGNEYVVTRTGKHFECTCPAGQFGRYCKHVKQVQKELGVY